MYTCMFNSCYSEPFTEDEADYNQLHNSASNICSACAEAILAGNNLGLSERNAAELRSEIKKARIAASENELP